MRRAWLVVAGVLLVGGCAATPALDDNRGAPIDDAVQQASRDAGFADCPRGSADVDRQIEVVCMTSGKREWLHAGGLPMVVNVWASWCEPCREEMPLLARAAEQFDGRVLFAGVDFADPAPLDGIALAGRSGVTYPQYADPGSELKAFFQLRGLPQTMFLSATGGIEGIEYSPFTSYDQVVADIEKYLGVTP